MVILRQETLLILHPGKAKFLPCWAILAADPQDGPTLALFEDITAKRAIAERLLLTRIASSIRFGSTSWPLLPAAAFPEKDPRVDKQLLIALLNIPDRLGSGGRIKMRPSPPIWLCAPSLDQFFGFIKHLSQSMSSIGLPAPERSQVESRDALHNYRPWPFQPANDWDHFWDSPAPGLTLMDATKSATVTSMDSHWGGTYKSIEGTLRGFEEMGTAKTSQFPAGKKSAKEGKNGLLKMADLKLAMVAAAVQEQRPTYVHVLPKAAELPEVQLRQMRQASITVTSKKLEETSGRWPTQQQQKQRQWERQNTQQSPVTVIQLLDNAIEEAEAGQPGQRPAAGRKYLDAEVQTDQTMASSAAGFRPILLEAAIPHQQQQLMNAAVADAADGKKANGRKDEQQNGGRLNSSNSSSNASSEFDQQADGQTETQAKTEVFGLEEDAAAGTRFYQVQLIAAEEEKEEEQKEQKMQKKKQNQQQQQQQQQQQYEEEATQF